MRANWNPEWGDEADFELPSKAEQQTRSEQ